MERHSRASGGSGAATPGSARTEVAGRHHGGGNQHSPSHRQQPARGWGARHHPHASQNPPGGGEAAFSRSEPQRGARGLRHRSAKSEAGPGSSRPNEEALSPLGGDHADGLARGGPHGGGGETTGAEMGSSGAAAGAGAESASQADERIDRAGAGADWRSGAETGHPLPT